MSYIHKNICNFNLTIDLWYLKQKQVLFTHNINVTYYKESSKKSVYGATFNIKFQVAAVHSGKIYVSALIYQIKL